MDVLGLPRVNVGLYAVVFSVNYGHKAYAVRCYIGQFPKRQERYDKLRQQLTAHPLQSFVDFEYIHEGILVRNAWYPIVRMDWVEGDALSRVLDRNLSAPILDYLARRWYGLLAELSRANMAHGDLHHGNILLEKSGNLRLIDYDAVYLPTLPKEPSHEVGHRNYQHPARTERDYVESVTNADSFSALVIYLALRALQFDPTLWKTFSDGENLLFRREDYERPGKTAVWTALENSWDQQVRQLTKMLARWCMMPTSAIPSLDQLLPHLQPRPSKSAAAFITPDAPLWEQLNRASVAPSLEIPKDKPQGQAKEQEAANSETLAAAGVRAAGADLNRLTKAVTDAYTRDELRRALRVGMEQDFDVLVADRAFGHQVFELVQWADRQGRLEALVTCVHENNHGNKALAVLYEEIVAPQLAAPAPMPAAPVESASAQPANGNQVFLAYSRKGAEFMLRLRADLLAEGIGVWVDDQDLEPGTLLWQRAIRARHS